MLGLRRKDRGMAVVGYKDRPVVLAQQEGRSRNWARGEGNEDKEVEEERDKDREL